MKTKRLLLLFLFLSCCSFLCAQIFDQDELSYLSTPFSNTAKGLKRPNYQVIIDTLGVHITNYTQQFYFNKYVTFRTIFDGSDEFKRNFCGPNNSNLHTFNDILKDLYPEIYSNPEKYQYTFLTLLFYGEEIMSLAFTEIWFYNINGNMNKQEIIKKFDDDRVVKLHSLIQATLGQDVKPASKAPEEKDKYFIHYILPFFYY